MNKQDVIDEGTNGIRGGTLSVPVAIEWAFDKGRESAAYAIGDFRAAATGKSNMDKDATLDVHITGEDSVDPRSMTPTVSPDGVVGTGGQVLPGQVDKSALGGYAADGSGPVPVEQTTQLNSTDGQRLEAGDTDNHSTERVGATVAVAQGVTLPGPDGSAPATVEAPAPLITPAPAVVTPTDGSPAVVPNAVTTAP